MASLNFRSPFAHGVDGLDAEKLQAQLQQNNGREGDMAIDDNLLQSLVRSTDALEQLQLQPGFTLPFGLDPMNSLYGQSQGLPDTLAALRPQLNLFQAVPTSLGQTVNTTQDTAPRQGSSTQQNTSSSGAGPAESDLHDAQAVGDGKTARRAQAIQEKNRRAQKRFRERQKERMKTMEEQVDGLSDEVKRLTSSNHNFQTRNAILEKVLALRDEQIQQYQERLKIFDANEDKAACGVTMTSPCVPVEVLKDQSAVKAIQNKTHEEVMQQWKGYVKDLADLLNEYELSSSKEEVAEKISRVVSQAGQLCMLTALFMPVNVKKMLMAAGDERQLALLGDPVQFWQPMLKALALTDQQVHELARLRSIFLSRSKQLLEERRHLAEQIKLATTHDFLNELRTPVRDLVKVYDCSAQLRLNLRDEHNAEIEFVATVYKKVLAPLQLARVLVHSYPLYPDALALASCVVADSKLEEVGVNPSAEKHRLLLNA